MSKLDRIAEMGSRLGVLLGESDASKLTESRERIVRDKAYTLVYNAIRKIRKCGKYVCRNEPERLKGYISQYMKRHRRGRSAPETTAEAS